MAEPVRGQAPRPLADRLRPQDLAEVVGQDHLLGADGPLGRMLAAAAPRLDDPVGTARLRQDHHRPPAGRADRPAFRAAVGGVFRRRRSAQGLRGRRASAARGGQGTLLFVDEIHRFNRAQQDGFLPYVEDGTVVLVGATTENPVLRTECRACCRAARCWCCAVSTTRRWTSCWPAPRPTLGRALAADDEARAALRAMADGDGRYLLNLAEAVWRAAARARRLTPRRWPLPCRSARRSTTRRRRATTT